MITKKDEGDGIDQPEIIETQEIDEAADELQRMGNVLELTVQLWGQLRARGNEGSGWHSSCNCVIS